MVSNEVSKLMLIHSAVAMGWWKRKTKNYHQKPHELPNNLGLKILGNEELLSTLFTSVFIEFLMILELVDSNS